MSTPGRCVYQAHPPLFFTPHANVQQGYSNALASVCLLSVSKKNASNMLAKTFADLVLNTGNVIGTFLHMYLIYVHAVLFAITVSHFLLSVCWLCPFWNCTWHSHTDSQLYCVPGSTNGARDEYSINTISCLLFVQCVVKLISGEESQWAVPMGSYWRVAMVFMCTTCIPTSTRCGDTDNQYVYVLEATKHACYYDGGITDEVGSENQW